MHYPFWDVDIGYGQLMGTIAVFHVFISHFAIGGGLYLVVAETFARKEGDLVRLQFLEGLSKFFVLTTVVMGAVSGVGIWFIIGLINPTATEMLIHNFVWGWAIEWTFFAVEILAAILYYYGWKRMAPRDHLTLGWIYFGAAWLSLFVINGIVTFMLTPGDWITTGNIWDGFWNPTFWSSLVFRTGICIMLAGLFAAMVAAGKRWQDQRTPLVRSISLWGLVGLVIMAPSFQWYFASIPSSVRESAAEMMPSVMDRLDDTYWYALALAVLMIFAVVLPRYYSHSVGIVAMALGLVWFGQYEWLRESIRKPFVIYDYMYGNALELNDEEQYAASGLLPSIIYRTGDDGADLFRRACRSCHTIDGYKPLAPIFDGTDPEFIAAMIRGTGVMKGNMPPFWGTAEESEMIASHIYEQVDQRTLESIYSLSGVELGAKVYEARCGSCHELGGYSDKTESLVGLEDEDYHDLLDNAADYGDGMPAYTGNETERAALIEFFKSLEEGGDDATAGL